METFLDLPPLAKKRARFFVSRLTMYIAVVMLSVCAASVYRFRTNTIFACPANGYTSDAYLAYCNARSYADYEHGAFAFELEPAAINFARNAQMLFLGNSHMQVAFSTAATSDWFSTASIRYYLMGFSYGENMVFAEFLLPKVRPQARIYVINVDDFFVHFRNRSGEADPARSGSASSIRGQALVAICPPARLRRVACALRERRCYLPVAQNRCLHGAHCHIENRGCFVRRDRR